MILGISASGRKGGVTGQAVQALLAATGLEYEYISLAGKKISGCIGCTLCAGDNTCKLQDDWNEIGKKMRQADAIVFGAPNYFDQMNALGHACWERTFSFRHREIFDLAGKLGVTVSVEYEGNDSVNSQIEYFMRRSHMAVLDRVAVHACGQCYTCGYGHDCGVGRVVRVHGFLDVIEDSQHPPDFAHQPEACHQAYRVGKILGSIVKSKL